MKLYFPLKSNFPDKTCFLLYLYLQTETETEFVTYRTTCATEGKSENCKCDCEKFRTGQFSQTQNKYFSRICRCFLWNYAFLPITLEHPDFYSFCSSNGYSKMKKKKKKKKKKKEKKKKRKKKSPRAWYKRSMWLSLFHTGILYQASLCLSRAH